MGEGSWDQRVARLGAWVRDPENVPPKIAKRMQDAAQRWTNISAVGVDALHLQAAVMEEAGGQFQFTGGKKPPAANDVDREAARTIYALTQEAFRQAGVTQVTLYRGIGTDQKLRRGAKVDPKQNPLSSWTTEMEVADGFAEYQSEERGKRGAVLKIRVPVSQVFATHEVLTALAPKNKMATEFEHIVLGVKLPKARVNSVIGKAEGDDEAVQLEGEENTDWLRNRPARI